MRLTPTFRGRRRRWLRPRGASGRPGNGGGDLCQIIAASRSRTRRFFQSRKKRTKRGLRRNPQVREDLGAVDPSFYNELVTFRDTDLGLETPDIGQILYTARTYVFELHSSDEDFGEDDDDEFGEVRRFPLDGVHLYYDSYGQVFPHYLWLEGLIEERYKKLEDDYVQYDGGVSGIEIEEKGSEEEGEAENLSEGTSGWGQRPLAPEGGHEQVQGSGQPGGHRDHWAPYSPLLTYWQGPWLSPYALYMEDEPDLPYGDLSDLNGSSLFDTHPWIAEDSENFMNLCQTDVTSVGVRGGATMLEGCGEARVGEEVEPGMLSGPQFTSSGVAVRAGDPSPARPFPPTRPSAEDTRFRIYQDYCSDENEPECCSPEAVNRANAERNVFLCRPQAKAMDKMFDSCGLKGRSSNVVRTSSLRGIPPGGNVAGGRLSMRSATPDGDNQSIPTWHHYERSAGDRRKVRYSGVPGRRETRLLDQTLQFPVTDKRAAPSSFDNATNACMRNGRERFAGGRDSSSKGAVSRQGARVQGSGTFGAVGQVGPGPPSVVPARPSARAYRHEHQTSGARQRQSEGRGSVASSSSASRRHGTPAGGNRSSDVEVTDVGVQCYSVGGDVPCSECGRRDFCWCEEEQQQDDQAMPCKASGIPVFQGRGGDGPPPPAPPSAPPPGSPPPPHPSPPPSRDSPRDEVPPARHSSGAGRGWGGGRRTLAATRAATGRSPGLCTRRGSFGAGRAEVQSVEEVSGRRRASLPGPGGGPGVSPPPADARSPLRSDSSDEARTPKDVTTDTEGGGYQQVSRTDSVSSGGDDFAGAGLGQKKTNPSPPARSSSIASRSVSPMASPGAPKRTMPGRRREANDNRTPPSTPLSRRPPPRAVYQVKLSPSTSPNDASHFPKKPSSKLPTVSNRSTISPNNDNINKENRNVSSSTQGRASAGFNNTLKDTTKASRVPDSPESMSGGRGDPLKGMSKSLKLDTPPKSLPLSLSLTSSPASTVEGESTSNDASLDLSAISGTLVSDSDSIPSEVPKPTQGLRRNIGLSNLTKTGGSNYNINNYNSNNNNSNCNNNNSSNNNNNNSNDSNSKNDINGTRKANAQLSRANQPHARVSGKGSSGGTTTATTTTTTSRRLADTKSSRNISTGTSQLKPKTPLTRTYSGPKSSLLTQGGASRGNIVRRVMNGSRTNLNKKKSNSRTSLIVGRHNLYNRSKSGSKGSLLGSRNNLFRSSLDSQRTESTTDSGCNSPLSGSQLSLDGDRRRPGSSSSSDHPRPSSSNASSPTDNLRPMTSSHLTSRRTRNATQTTRGPVQTTAKTRGLLTKGHGSRTMARPSTFAPLASPEPDPSCAPEPEDIDDKPPSQPPSPPPSPPEAPTPSPSYTHSSSPSSLKALLNDSKPKRGGETMDVVQIVHAHSSSLSEQRQKTPVSVKRSFSLQLPHEESRPDVPPKPTFLRVESVSSINSRGDGKDLEGSSDQALPGISVSFRSVPSSVPDDIGSRRDSGGGDRVRGRSVEKERKEITTVSIRNEPQPILKEEKGVQVEEFSGSEGEQEEEDNDCYAENSGTGLSDAMGTWRPQRQQANQVHVIEPDQERHRFLKSLSDPLNHHSATPLSKAPTTSGIAAAPQFGAERVRKNTIVHITSTPKEAQQVKVDKRTGPKDKEAVVEEATRTDQKEGGPSEAEDNKHLINRLESSLADIIDATVLKNFKINGNILTNQFDAIIATLKKVAASVEAGESAETNFFGRSDPESGVKGRSRTPSSTPSSPMTPLSPTSISSMSSSSMSPISPSTPKTPSSKNPLSLFSISEGPGHVSTPPMPPKTRKFSLPKDSLEEDSPTLGDLARRLHAHANPNHLRADQDFVECMDLDRPYGDLIRNEAPPKTYGRKNSTGSLGLSSCASLLYDNSYYTKPPTSTASATNLNTEDDCNGVFVPHWNSFRKVHSISNVTGNGTGAPPRIYQRHLSLEGPDDARTEHRLRKSLSKSRELLSQLELEYKKIKGEESKSNRNSFVMDGSWLDTDFDELVSSLSKGDSSAHEALAFLTSNDLPSSSSTSSINRSDRTKGSKKDSSFESPGAKRHHPLGQQPQQQVSEGRHIFSFFQKKGRSQSLSGTEAIKISLPTTPEDAPKGTSHPLQEAQDCRGGVPGSGRIFRPYESANLDRRGRTSRSNSIPSGSPHTPTGVALPHELIGILKKSRNKSLNKIHDGETKDTKGAGTPLEDERTLNSEEEEEEEEGGGGEEDEEEEEEDGKQQRSLSLPKSFLSDKYGLTGIKAALPSVIFPWRRGDPSRNSGRSFPYVTTPTSNGPSLADASTQSPCATSYSNDQSTAGEPSVDFAYGDREPAGEAKTKESVWRRSKSGAGVSRTTRKEKANSSPVFRRASLSHSEWDIRRPWSHVYSDREAAKLSQSVCRLAMTSAGEGPTQVEGAPDGEGPRSLPFMPASPSNTPEGMFQKFKKSLSLRLAKKANRAESPGPSSPAVLVPVASDHGSSLESSSATLPRRRGHSHKEEDPKPGFLFGHPLFRSSKERRRARLKDARAAKCNSGDSGDSGIELVTTLGPAVGSDVTTPRPSESDSSNYNGHMTASLADEGGPGHSLHHQHHAFSHQGVRRTHSDVGGAARLQEALRHYQRQYSTPQPIKLRPAHRLPQHTGSLHRSKSSMKRSKGSSHLRRSISQPLDLDKALDLSSPLRKVQNSPSHTPPKRQRRPSAGNILNEDNTTSEDEICMSDSEDFRTDLKRSLDEEDMVVYAEALWDHVTLDVEELVFKAGDLITVVDSSDKDWWWGKIHHRTGWFPAAFVRLLVNQEDHQEPKDYQHKGPERKLSISALSQEQVRANVINEIICTERDFVKHLRDVVEGYLKQVRKRPDMFTEETISTIFGNMEALYRFQSTFLRDLEDCIDWEQPHKSCIGAVFTKNRAKFEIYSEYCNNHPSALSELQELYQDQKIVHFFEACRLLQEMIDISLDGFLLTPVQKICKYPLQLQELLKYTKPDHPDYQSVQGALEAMRDVALLVNERKRRMECLEKIASWQITVEGWEGPELLEDSSQLIYQGEVTKGHGGSWPKEVTLFLFDRQLVYCKRDLLKRNTYVYRGRLNLNTCEVVELMDGKDTRLNATFHNAWKVHSHEKNKWYIFSCKSAEEKRKWMEAFRKERELVAADLNAKFIVSDKAKQHAKIAARNQKNRPKRPRTTKCHKHAQAMTYAQAELLVNVDPDIRSNSLPSGVQPLEGKKKGLWFSFGGNKKGRGSGRGLAGPVQHHPV